MPRVQKDEEPRQSPKEAVNKRVKQKQPRRRFPSASPAAESHYSRFETLVSRIREMSGQLDREDMQREHELSGLDLGEKEWVEDFGSPVSVFDFSDDEGRPMEPISLGREEAELLIAQLKRMAQGMYADFTAPAYPFPAISHAARRLYGPARIQRKPMTQNQVKKYSAQTPGLVKGYGGDWDVNLDPTRPEKKEE